MPQAKRKLTVEDLWKVSRVGTPVATADGSVMVVPVSTHDMETNESTARLYRLGSPGSEPRALTAATVKSTQPRLSPDGSRLAFLREDENKKPQLAIMPLDGGEAELVTELPLGVGTYRWMPDGKGFALLVPLLQDAPTIEGTAALQKEREENKVKAYVTESRVARYWDSWITEGRIHHVMTFNLETRTPVDLTPDFTGWFDPDSAEEELDVAPDGNEIAFAADRSEHPHHTLNWDVFIVPTAGGEIRNLTKDNPLHENRPRYSPDGAYLVYGMQIKPGFYADNVRLVRYDRSSGKHTVLTENWDRSASGWSFVPGTNTLVFLAEDRATSALFTLDLEPGEPRPLARGGSIHGAVPLADGRVLSSWDDFSHPPEAVIYENGERKALTRFNQDLVDSIHWGEIHEKSVPGADGKPVQYYEILPPGFTPEKKWPLILAVHGGPHGIWSPSFHFRWNMQLFAAPGYVVIAPNPHGSTSFGQDYAECIQGGWGDKPHTDCMAVTDAAVASGYIDEKRMAAAGGSYGGYMMAWFAGHTDRFACLINHAGVSNLLSEYASDVTDGWGKAMGGEPWEGIENIDAMNPIRFASGFVSPMLVIHGELDYRVPVTQGLEIYNIYKAKGLPSRLVVFPDENHWILKPQNSRFWYGEFNQWLTRWLGKPGPSSS